MDIGSIFVIITIALLVVVYIIQPLLDTNKKVAVISEQKTANEKDHVRSALLAERDRILTALQELEFDNVLGKIPEEDYPVQRANLVRAGADVLRQIDESSLVASQTPGQPEDWIEAEIAARRADAGNTARELDEVELAIAARHRARMEKSVGFCTKCGNPLQHSDVFCSKCGQPVEKSS